MSRIGLKPIPLPSGVDADVQAGLVTIKGPKGALKVALPPGVLVALSPEPASPASLPPASRLPAGQAGTGWDWQAGGRALEVRVEHPDAVRERAIWGLARQLVANAVAGVQKPYEKALEFVGIGYKISLSGRNVKMEVGFSHPVEFSLPEGIDGKVEKQVLTLSGIDKALVGETAARIRRIRPPEPYKGKGIKYTDEVIRRKAGKTAKAAAA